MIKQALCPLIIGPTHIEYFVTLVSSVWSITGRPANKGACSDQFSEVTLQGFWEINFKHKKMLFAVANMQSCQVQI